MPVYKKRAVLIFLGGALLWPVGLPSTLAESSPQRRAATTRQAAVQRLAAELERKHGINVKVSPGVVRAVSAMRDGPQRDDFEAALKRLAAMETEVAEPLKQGDLAPLSLAVAIVESGLKPKAGSPGAQEPVGYYQLMPRTARSYGLKVTQRRDERLNPLAAREAAESLLQDLYQQFGGWSKALAAYNQGEGSVLVSGATETPYVRRVLATALLLVEEGGV